MSKFNSPSVGTKTTNKAGGDAYTQSPKLELASILLTSFANDTFYSTAKNDYSRMKSLAMADPLFAAKAAIFARREFGMRSITHMLAAQIAPAVSATKWGQRFYKEIVYRPDDMLEIIAIMKANKQKLPNAMKKGFAKAFDNFDAYQLAKYRGEGKAIKLVDVVNLVHPVPTEKNTEALAALMKGTLKSDATWEAKLTKAGQIDGTQEEKIEAKKEAWAEMVNSGRLGYFALLRNLRNILEADPGLTDAVVQQLTDEKKIKKSLVLPFRFFTAVEELMLLPNSRNIVAAIGKAAEISLNNVPKFPGRTLIAVDVSSSMKGTPEKVARMFGAVLYKALDADILTFDGSARFISLNPMDSVLTLMKGLQFRGGSTNFHSIFTTAHEKYDRIIILSDMQAWVSGYGFGSSNPRQSLEEYKRRTGADPLIYSFDLNHAGSMQFPERNVYCLTGFSDKVFDIMGMLETDRNALIHRIESIEV